MKSIGIFCGSSAGEHPLYLETARLVGRTLAQQGLALVYGGGKVGLMGAVADAALEAGGVVIGVMPRGLVEREIAHRGLTELHVVEDMHERKTKMAALADGFIALPGGAGTLEEIFEQWTWAQLGIHEKPCAFLNIKVITIRFRRWSITWYGKGLCTRATRRCCRSLPRQTRLSPVFATIRRRPENGFSSQLFKHQAQGKQRADDEQ
ncbi:lysine decarboxylase family protein [Klebsiella pneumoniae]|nr:lysine decarboxylase family protein [Klebsiella pneumoniae]